MGHAGSTKESDPRGFRKMRAIQGLGGGLSHCSGLGAGWPDRTGDHRRGRNASLDAIHGPDRSGIHSGCLGCGGIPTDRRGHNNSNLRQMLKPISRRLTEQLISILRDS